MMRLRAPTAEDRYLQGIPAQAVNHASFAPSCSVVICTPDRPAELERCLEMVSRIVYPRFDVIVVDNAPCDTGARKVSARWGVRYITEPVPGLSRARNRGAH